MTNGEIDFGVNPVTATVPKAEPLLVSYDGPSGRIWGAAHVVASIVRADRLFDLYETITLAALFVVTTMITSLLVIYAPSGRGELVTLMAATGWILALCLGGFTTFRISASSSGFNIWGGEHGGIKPKLDTQQR
jgi:hypothetical protein